MSTGVIHQNIHGIWVRASGATIPANAISVSVTANIPEGWKFLCWLCGTSTGWTGHVYPSVSTNATTIFWTTESPTASARNIMTYAMLYR